MARRIDAQRIAPLKARQLIGVWLALMEAHASVVEHLDVALRKGHRLSGGQFEILARLAHGPPEGLRMQDLASELYISRSSATRLVDALEGEDLVHRTTFAPDRRGTLAHLTDKGREKFLSASETFLSVAEERFHRVASPDMARLEKALTDIAAGTGEQRNG